jgi:hypothetical protein
MSKSVAVLNRFMLGYLNNLVADIPEQMLYRHQDRKINSPGWCLGHLAVETDDAYKYLGNASLIPDDWYALFFYTAPPLDIDQALPSKGELIDAVNSVFQALNSAFERLDDAFLDRPCHSNFLKSYLNTEREWFIHVLTTHLATHAGNIAIWRRFCELGPAKY